MVDAITTYQIEVMTTGRLAGRCRICGGRSDEKLLSLASSLKKWLEWLEKRKPREILNLLERPGSGENSGRRFLLRIHPNSLFRPSPSLAQH
jgi:hypothetical protein